MALVTYGSTFVLVALSIDRLDAIARPLRFSDGGRRCRILIGVSWGLAALYSIPSAIIFKGDHCYAYLTQSQWQIYLTLVATLVFFIPAIIIAICYGAMICIIWRHTQIPKCGEKVSCTTPMYPKDGYENDNSRQKRPFRFRGRDTSMSSRGVIPQAKIRTIKMTFVIILVFILCWSPFFIYNLLSVYGVIPLDQTTIAMSAFKQSLAPLNSAANPMIYGVFSTRICRQLR
ncbi:hypothetical protein FSP39_022196 [Pinctada imbricata]|uniref:G-protein coupled receptors family 1 profile domain-containing protein n=1 Tax=Pinctada imbricata TaxID=66713 RepID=A0AA89BQ70_PINIB|nr:hypothetical protein FSP39_022196 [Pinctada imbricata]